MGKNLDTDSIFGSYINNVLLKEAVKPIESTAPAAPLTPEQRAYVDSTNAARVKVSKPLINDTQGKLMFDNDKRIKQGATNTVPGPASPAPVTPAPVALAPVAPRPAAPAAAPAPQASNQNQDDDGIDWDSVEPTETTTQVIPNAVKTSTVATPNTSSIRPAAGAAITDTENSVEPTETTTEVIPNATQTTSIAAEDDENFHPYQKKIQKIAEKRNISKFLRHLSEKNYSSAHKYLKAVLNSKINNIVSERINKNFN